MSDLSKMVTFIKMVITGVENWSPDMIPVAFEGKFDEKKDEIPPGICRVDGRLKKHKNSHKWDHMGSPMARILHAP